MCIRGLYGRTTDTPQDDEIKRVRAQNDELRAQCEHAKEDAQVARAAATAAAGKAEAAERQTRDLQDAADAAREAALIERSRLVRAPAAPAALRCLGPAATLKGFSVSPAPVRLCVC